MELGLRVVRGPDWKWGLQDGGVGHVGTVVDIGSRNSRTIPSKTVVVQWDSGSRSNYRVGYQGEYDLRVLDNAPAGANHPRVKCDSCGSAGIIGMRWQCSICIEFDLCTPCYMKGAHDLNHPFIRIDTIYHIGVEVPKRSQNNSVRIQARGIFKGARVVRGYDWEWDQQDGGDGKIGEVIDIRDWDAASGRSVANVKWQRSSNVYRVGHKGKVDIKCVVDAMGGYYYRDHLPILGQNFVVSGPLESLVGATATARPEIASSQQRQQQSSSSSSSSSSVGAMAECPFNIGDNVRVVVNSVEDLKSLQKDHGGWNTKMAQFINKVGIVHRITDKRDIRVQFDKSRIRWTFNPNALEKYSCFAVGDYVKIIDDEDTVKKLQKNHGEYVPEMSNILGANGRVIKVYTDGDLRVNFENKTWTFNHQCCINLSEIKRVEQAKNKKDVYTLKDWLNELGPLAEGSREIYSADNKPSIEGADPANTSTSSNSKSMNNNNPTSSNSSISDSASYQLNATSDTNSTDIKCLICDENFANIRFHPCTHQVCCSECSDCIIRMKRCISCKQVIKKLLYIESSNGQIYGIVDHGASFSNSSSKMSFGSLPSSSTTSLLNNNQAKTLNTRMCCSGAESNISDPMQRLKFLEAKYLEIEEANTCGICLESTKNIIFLCGHGACSSCSSTLSICHMCRKTITKKINIY